MANWRRDYERLTKILNRSELLYLKSLIPEDDKEHEDLRQLFDAAAGWIHQFGKSDHGEE